MGFWDTVKGWFNIGGVKVKIEGLNTQVPKSGSKLTAKVQPEHQERQDGHQGRVQVPAQENDRP